MISFKHLLAPAPHSFPLNTFLLALKKTNEIVHYGTFKQVLIGLP
jgi:hypothetical protein